jgi:hypothetical protein
MEQGSIPTKDWNYFPPFQRESNIYVKRIIKINLIFFFGNVVFS